MKLRDQVILGIEGSGNSVSVGIMCGGSPKGLVYVSGHSITSKSLLKSIDMMLEELEIEKEELDGVAVCLGPGSFTSVRISIATAEALGVGLNIPVYGVDLLKLIADTAAYYPAKVRVIQDAYKGEFYTATFDCSSGKSVLQDEIHLVTPDDFYKSLESNELVLGTGLNRLLSLGLNPADRGAKVDQSFFRQASGIGVVEHFLDSEAQKPSQLPLEPIYIRLSEAEIAYDQKYGKG